MMVSHTEKYRTHTVCCTTNPSCLTPTESSPSIVTPSLIRKWFSEIFTETACSASGDSPSSSMFCNHSEMWRHLRTRPTSCLSSRRKPVITPQIICIYLQKFRVQTSFQNISSALINLTNRSSVTISHKNLYSTTSLKNVRFMLKALQTRQLCFAQHCSMLFHCCALSPLVCLSSVILLFFHLLPHPAKPPR